MLLLYFAQQHQKGTKIPQKPEVSYCILLSCLYSSSRSWYKSY